MDLSQLTDEAYEYVETIGGMTFRFSELPLAALARLQSWLRDNVPHPIEAIAPHLGGLTEEERREMLEAARIEAREWPPKIGGTVAALALLGSELGQIEVFYEGLLVHHPDATREDAFRLYRIFRHETARDIEVGKAEAARVRKLFGTLFGAEDFGAEAGNSHPKGEAAPLPMPMPPSDGRSSLVGVSKN